MGATDVSIKQNSQDYEMEIDPIIIDVFERSEMGGSKVWVGKHSERKYGERQLKLVLRVV